MSGCCSKFTSNDVAASRSQGPSHIALDHCGDKAMYDGAAGEDFAWGTPVAPGAAPGEVTPALDGVGAIGVSCSDVAAGATERKVTVFRTGHIKWSDMADAVGQAANDQAAWWAIHVELAKLNIYVEFA